MELPEVLVNVIQIVFIAVVTGAGILSLITYTITVDLTKFNREAISVGDFVASLNCLVEIDSGGVPIKGLFSLSKINQERARTNTKTSGISCFDYSKSINVIIDGGGNTYSLGNTLSEDNSYSAEFLGALKSNEISLAKITVRVER